MNNVQNKDNIKLSTGKILDPHCGFVGINVDGELSDGFDSCFYCYEDEHVRSWGSADSPDVLTRDERIELAEVVISRWQQWLDIWKKS